MTWFEKLTGFSEVSPDQVRDNLELEGEWLVSKANSRRIRCGRLDVTRIDALEADARKLAPSAGNGLQLSESVGDVGALHEADENAGALFQAASQFNLLEMAAPNVTPDQGVAIYEYDRTQGPVCAIACGGGTIYRNYFAGPGGRIGQTASHQIDCLGDIGEALGNGRKGFWSLQNGYAFSSDEGLDALNMVLEGMGAPQLRALEGRLRIGLQWDAEVTRVAGGKTVSQAYCSALPLGYSSVSRQKWESFARLILRATYRGTFAAAAQNAYRTGNNKVYLTLVGGGVFGNPINWILDAIGQAAQAYVDYDLDCRIVSYGQSDSRVADFVRGWAEK